LLKAYGGNINPERVGEVEEIAGHGVIAEVDGKNVIAGNAKLMQMKNIPYRTDDITGTAVHAAVDGVYAGVYYYLRRNKGRCP
jgi:Cd2+/Zn2+-exporting ATPase